MKPTTINTIERIFKVETHENETYLCNINTAPPLRDIKNLWHLWNFEWDRFSKKDLKDMLKLAAKAKKESEKKHKADIRDENEYWERLESTERKYCDF